MQHVYIHVPFVVRIWQLCYVKISTASVCKNINTKQFIIYPFTFSLSTDTKILLFESFVRMEHCDKKLLLIRDYNFCTSTKFRAEGWNFLLFYPLVQFVPSFFQTMLQLSTSKNYVCKCYFQRDGMYCTADSHLQWFWCYGCSHFECIHASICKREGVNHSGSEFNKETGMVIRVIYWFNSMEVAFRGHLANCIQSMGYLHCLMNPDL